MAGKTIKPIEKGAIHRICSGQVVLDLATAVKELVENSLDAGATSVEIRLKDHGTELIEVADNGSGISPENYQALTLKYHTSKISEFADLQSLSSFGFRGEALSSLCALANVSVITRTKEEAIATRVVYDHSGVITSEEKLARAIGTTVSVAKLFSTLPVRFKEFNRNTRREYGRLLTVLQAYALICKGVKLLCSNQTGRGGRTTVLQTQGSSSIKDNIVTIFGTKAAACVEWLDLAISENCFVEGFVSKAGTGCGRASGDRQFFYVNGRPVDMPKVAKLLNELYKSFNSLQYPMIVLNFILPTTFYDVNVTPDKRKIFLHSEGALMVALREALEKVYSPNKYTYMLNTPKKLTIAGDVASTDKLPIKKRIHKCAHPEAGDESDSESDSEKVTGSGMKHTNGNWNKSPVGRQSDDITSFQRSSLGLSNIKKGLTDKVGISAGAVGESILAAQPARKVQATLTSCVSKGKRKADLKEGLLSEEPLLKKLFEGVAAVKSSSSISRGKYSNGLDDSEVEDGDITGHGALYQHARGTLSVENTFSYSAGSAIVPTFSTKVQEERSSDSDSVDTNEDHMARELSSANSFKEASSSCKRSELDHSGVKANTSEPDFETDTENHRSPHGEHFEDMDPQTCIMRPCAKVGEEKCRPPRLNFELVANELAEMRSKLAGSKPPSNTIGEGRICSSHNVGADLNEVISPFKARSCIVDVEGPPDISLPYHQEELEEPGCSTLTVEFNIEKLRKNFKRVSILRSIIKDIIRRQELSKSSSCFTAATLASSGREKEGTEKQTALAAATKELERMFNKADFKRMQVLGQFNMGFILAKIDQDIFIVDQHASDEKYNFERLTKSTVLNRQPLLRPLPLELSAADEITVTTHAEVFRNSRTKIEDQPEGQINALYLNLPEVNVLCAQKDAPVGQRLRLSAIPFSKNITFGVGDFQELISLLADEPAMSFGPDSGESHDDNISGLSPMSKWFPRPSRVRAMLASRACRSSTMIGDPLSKTEMERILSHLAELDSPWNCPHGRPTMRHLVDLGSLGKHFSSTRLS